MAKRAKAGRVGGNCQNNIAIGSICKFKHLNEGPEKRGMTAGVAIFDHIKGLAIRSDGAPSSVGNRPEVVAGIRAVGAPANGGRNGLPLSVILAGNRPDLALIAGSFPLFNHHALPSVPCVASFALHSAPPFVGCPPCPKADHPRGQVARAVEH